MVIRTTVTNGDGVIGLEGNISSFMNYKDVLENHIRKLIFHKLMVVIIRHFMEF